MLSQSRFETEVSKKKQGKGSFFSLAGRPRSHATISFWDFVPERCNFTRCHMRPLFFYLADAARDSFFPERTLSQISILSRIIFDLSHVRNAAAYYGALK